MNLHNYFFLLLQTNIFICSLVTAKITLFRSLFPSLKQLLYCLSTNPYKTFFSETYLLPIMIELVHSDCNYSMLFKRLFLTQILGNFMRPQRSTSTAKTTATTNNNNYTSSITIGSSVLPLRPPPPPSPRKNMWLHFFKVTL